MSVFAYIWPLLNGSCIYTIPKDRVKHEYIYTLLEEQKLTVLIAVPSILQYFKPYLSEINFEQVKYSIFSGEALSLENVESWIPCMPNATIINFYGPTECTVFCTYYEYRKGQTNKSLNGVLSIGKPMEGTEVLLLNENNEAVKEEREIGELCLASAQLTQGYWKNEVKNAESFFSSKTSYGYEKRFYRTGDLCFKDLEGALYYVGRRDSQVKIQGFRVELSEIVFQCKAFGLSCESLALPFKNESDLTEIGIVLVALPFDTSALLLYLQQNLPVYMLPSRIIFEPAFPLNRNGKTDREVLKQRLCLYDGK